MDEKISNESFLSRSRVRLSLKSNLLTNDIHLNGVGKGSVLFAIVVVVIVRGILNGFAVKGTLVERSMHVQNENDDGPVGLIVVLNGRVSLETIVDVERKMKMYGGPSARHHARQAN